MSPADVPLRRLFSSVRGGSWGADPDDGEVVLPCVRGTDFDYTRLRTDLSRAPLRGFSRVELAARAAQRGDLIIEKSGGGEQQPVGRVVLHDLNEVVMPTNFAGRLRPTADVDSRFACYLLASLYSDGRTCATIKQTTGIQNLDLGSFLSFRVTRPSLNDQLIIADFLDGETARIDALITKKLYLIELMKARRQTWLGRFFSEHGKLYRLKHLLAQSPCYGVLVPTFVDDGVPFIRVNDIRALASRAATLAQISVVQSNEYRRTVVNVGDVLLSVVGSVDKVAVAGPNVAGANVARAVTRLVPDIGVPSELLAQWFTTTQYLDQARLATESDTAQPTLNMGDLANFEVSFPSPKVRESVLQRSCSVLADHDKAESLLRQQIDLLRERRQALITAAVTGERAQDAADIAICEAVKARHEPGVPHEEFMADLGREDAETPRA